jgi:hypothetical protein
VAPKYSHFKTVIIIKLYEFFNLMALIKAFITINHKLSIYDFSTSIAATCSPETSPFSDVAQYNRPDKDPGINPTCENPCDFSTDIDSFVSYSQCVQALEKESMPTA